MDPLLDALGDDDPTVSQAAADAVVRIDGEVGDRLVPLLRDPMRASAALDALVRLPDVGLEVLRHRRRRAGPGPALSRALARGEHGRRGGSGAARRGAPEPSPPARRPGRPGTRRPVQPRVGGVDLESAVSRDPAQRAYGLEQLEGSGDARVIRPLLEVWEPAPARRPFEAGSLRPMFEDDDPWIRACAAFAARYFADAPLASPSERGPSTIPIPWSATPRAGRCAKMASWRPSDRLSARPGDGPGRVPLFRELSPEDLKHVAASLVENAYPDGSLIAGQGEAGGVMHVVVSGEIRVLRHGDEVELARRGPGYIVGEMAILTGEPRMADLVAVGEVRTLSIDQQRFRRVLRERPDAALAVMRELCFRVAEASGPHPEAPARP